MATPAAASPTKDTLRAFPAPVLEEVDVLPGVDEVPVWVAAEALPVPLRPDAAEELPVLAAPAVGIKGDDSA